MLSNVLSAVLLAGSVFAAAGTVVDCPASKPCYCDKKDGGYTCRAKDSKNCAYSKQPPKCDGHSHGDPLVKGFDGCAWYLHGKPDTVMNLISEANHVVNTYLVPANLTDEHHGGEGTFHGAISVRFQNMIVTSRVTSEGNLTVEAGGEVVPFGVVQEKFGMIFKVTEHYPFYGQVVEIVTPAFRFFVHAVQPFDTPAGWSRGHLDFSATAITTSMMHGLLGQSISSAGALCSTDFNFHGEGQEEEYQLPDLEDVDFLYSLFVEKNAARRLQYSTAMYTPASTTHTATSKGFLYI